VIKVEAVSHKAGNTMRNETKPTQRITKKREKEIYVIQILERNMEKRKMHKNKQKKKYTYIATGYNRIENYDKLRKYIILIVRKYPIFFRCF
jgi:vacuolar-type H+-ATPase subunit I/STV1